LRLFQIIPNWQERETQKQGNEFDLLTFGWFRADRAARYQTAQATEEERRKTAQIAQEQLKQERAAVAAAARSAFTRLQFRLPDGSTRTDQFASDQRLVDVTNYIDREIRPPFK